MTENDTKATGLIANKGIELLSWATPNGFKIAWVLQELHDAYGLEFTAQSIDLPTFVQKEPWYLKVNPNGKIPAIVDHDNGDFKLWEGTVIITYLVTKYDKDHLISFPPGTKDFYNLLLALEFGSSDLGPAQGLAGEFYRLDPERDAYGTQKLIGQVERCYGVLNTQLQGRDYISGPGKGKFTVADIGLWMFADYIWFSGTAFLGDLGKWPEVKRWYERIYEEKRVTIEKVSTIPLVPRGRNGLLRKAYEGDEGFRAREDELRKVLEEGREKYGYVYRAA